MQTAELFTPDGSNMTHNDPGLLCTARDDITGVRGDKYNLQFETIKFVIWHKYNFQSKTNKICNLTQKYFAI